MTSFNAVPSATLEDIEDELYEDAKPASSPTSTTWSRVQETLRSKTGRVCAVLFLDVLAFSCAIPVLPTLILQLTDGDAGQAAFLQGLAASVDGSLKFFMQPFLGRLSDSVGRKPVLAYSLVGSALSFALYVVMPSIPSLFVSHALHGLSQCTFIISMSAIADDVHNPNDPSALTHAYGLVGVALGVAFVLGPVFGGGLSIVLGIRAVYMVSTLLFLLTFWALWSFMIETLDVDKRRPFAWKEAIPLRAAHQLFSRSSGLMILSASYFLCSLTVGVYGVWILYTTVMFGWGPLMAGVLLSLNGVIVVIGQGFVLRALVPNRCSESTVALVSYFAHAVLFILIGISTSGEMMLISICLVGVLASLGEPAIKSIMSHAVPKEEQGALQGVMGSVYVLAGIIAPLVYSALFRYSISQPMRDLYPMPCPQGYVPSPEVGKEANPCGGLPGLPFILQAIVFLFATLLMRHGFRALSDEGHSTIIDGSPSSKPSNESANENNTRGMNGSHGVRGAGVNRGGEEEDDNDAEMELRPLNKR